MEIYFSIFNGDFHFAELSITKGIRVPAVAGPRWSTTAGSVGSLEDQHGPGHFGRQYFGRLQENHDWR